jgi:hypothetical protein
MGVNGNLWIISINTGLTAGRRRAKNTVDPLPGGNMFLLRSGLRGTVASSETFRTAVAALDFRAEVPDGL